MPAMTWIGSDLCTSEAGKIAGDDRLACQERVNLRARGRICKSGKRRIKTK